MTTITTPDTRHAVTRRVTADDVLGVASAETLCGREVGGYVADTGSPVLCADCIRAAQRNAERAFLDSASPHAD